MKLIFQYDINKIFMAVESISWRVLRQLLTIHFSFTIAGPAAIAAHSTNVVQEKGHELFQLFPKIIFEVLMQEVTEQDNRKEHDNDPKRNGFLLPSDEGEASQGEDKNNHCRNYEISNSQNRYDWHDD